MFAGRQCSPGVAPASEERGSGFVSPDEHHKFGAYSEPLQRRLFRLAIQIETKGSAVLCVADGAGQDFLQKTIATDASGNIVFGDIGVHIQQETKKYFKELGVPVDVKYIEPTYMIRACHANASDGILCAVLGQNAVHDAFAGHSGITVGICNTHCVYLPIPDAIS